MLAPNWTLGRLFFGKRGLLPEKENKLVGIAVYFYHFLNQETWCDEDNLQYISKCSVVKPGKKGRGMEIKKYCVSGWRPRFFQYRTVLAQLPHSVDRSALLTRAYVFFSHYVMPRPKS